MSMTSSTIRREAPILVAGGRGMVGSAIVRRIATAAERPRAEVLKEVGDYVESLIKALP